MLDELLRFWFDERSKPFWFERSPEFDAGVRGHCIPMIAAAAHGELSHWRETGRGCLGLCILLDQCPRNVFRGTPRAFAYDALANAVAERVVAQGLDRAFEEEERLFLYLPFEHREDLAAQDRSVALFSAMSNPKWIDYAIRHREIIARFGRFPHRNGVLGRASTPEEEVFLAGPGSSF